jgi:glycosyltransferase involved in cell wall biosynthesis
MMNSNVDKSVFDAAWYLAEYPDVALSGMDPFEHYQWIGHKLGRAPNSSTSGSRIARRWDKDTTAAATSSPSNAPSAPVPDNQPESPVGYRKPTTRDGGRLAHFYASEGGPAEDPALSPLMRYVWNSRSDLRATFDLAAPHGRKDFTEWFQRNFGSEYDLPSTLPNAPGNLQEGGANLLGYARTPSGRGEDVRMVAEALAANDYPFALRDIPTGATYRDPSVEKWISNDQPYRTNIFHVNADMFPIEALKFGHGHHNIGYWAWELAQCPPCFDDALQLVDEVWGISEFVSNAFRERADVPVYTMPLAVQVPELNPEMCNLARFGLDDEPFTFLFTFDAFSYLDRKNPIDVVRAFKRAFPNGKENVQLVLKTQNISKVVGSSHASFLWDELLSEIGDSPRTKVIDRTFSREEVCALTAACDAFVSLHRSEGFGRNLAETMLYGRPVISTDYSGSKEFIRDDTAIPIGYSLVPVGEGAYPYADGQFWAQPDVDHAAWAMHRLVEDDTWRNEVARSGQAFVREHLNAKVIGQRYVERLQAARGPELVQVPAPIRTPSGNTVLDKLHRHVEGKSTALFTIVSRNYMALARAVLQSVRDQHPEFALFICLVDDSEGLEFAEMDDFQIVQVSDIDLPNFLDMRVRYDVMELNTAVKPFFIDWMYQQTDVDKVIYFDPDLFLYKPLSEVLGPLDAGHSVVLTPHMNRPIEDDGEAPTDHSIMQSGVFNLGFIATRRCDETRRFIQWWAEKLETASISDVQNNLFTDQRWCDFAPCFLPNLKVLHHEGHNVAYWNLDQRKVEKHSDGSITVNDYPLIFFHFSGFNPRKLEQVSKHQTRFTWDNISPATRDLMRDYGKRLLENDYEISTKVPYAYDEIDGLKIRPAMRQIYRQAYPQPHIFRSEQEARKRLAELCLEPSDVAPADGGETFSKLTMQIYKLRPDVQAAFPIASAQGVSGFRNWFNHSIKAEYGIDLENLSRAR